MAKDLFTDYPYVIHTNRELELMLAGKKSLAWFPHELVEGFDKQDAHGGQDFDRYVGEGRLTAHKRTYDFGKIETRAPYLGETFRIDDYFYTLPTQEWRVDAFWMLIKSSRAGRWCAHLERLQGELLGYTDAQNDYHINQRYIPLMRERRNNKERTRGCEA